MQTSSTTFIMDEEKRVCKACGKEKITVVDFYYNSNTGYYTRFCKGCVNETKKERNKNKLKSPKRLKKKVCIYCKLEKDLNTENFLIRSNKFSSSCKECYEGFLEKNREGKDSYFLPARFSRKYTTYRIEDFNKGREFKLTREYLEKCLSSPCVYCGYSSTGLDRLDNSLGHTDGNCVPCCAQCNHAKNNYFTYEEMLKIGSTIRDVKLSRNL